MPTTWNWPGATWGHSDAAPGATVSVKMQYFRRSLQYLRPYSRLAAASSVVLVAAALIGLLAPWPLKVVIDHALGHQPLPGWFARLLGPAAGNKITLIVLAVIAGFVINFTGDALTVLDSFLNTT